jgi:hypothetical protein
MAPPATKPRKPSKKGRRLCRMCSRRIDPNEEAVRVADIKHWDNLGGKVRYWLCWRCAGELEAVLDAICGVHR